MNFRSKNRNKHIGYFMYGTHAVLSALNNPKRQVHNLYCTSKCAGELSKQLAPHKPEIVSSDFITSKIGKDVNHQGILAHVNTIFKNDIEELDFTNNQDKVAILDQISDPQNVGAIIRSAAAFGITKILLPKDNTPDENATIAKAASGCLELVQVSRITNIQNAIKFLKNKGFWIVGLDANGHSHIKDIRSIDKTVIIIGSEEKGMRKLTAEACDFLVNIPISSKVESLNASTAASIVFYSLSNI
ncbi:MAG: 23S rRNA (guanosine(2251)-2'-O)-methyltransferase RlmB [Rickettsiales bacterium]|nr:23S rRNA (guanosine(2251)-2'-O)-methyltransferase RlmB [Rickettsiales bacterium]MCA0253963.1 23S rRNA (guanosine(2251)-2'-O)-methyltransferase RlmB [Pseudomonadota bacterium]